jgi:hypothetical protein
LFAQIVVSFTTHVASLGVIMQITEQQKLAAHRILLQDTYKESLYRTAKNLLGYQDVNKKTHGPICETLESSTKRKLIVCPRGAFKSTVGVVSYSIWILLNDPNARILIDSEVFTNSRNFLREIKAHLESFKVVSVFGNFKTKDDWTQSSLTIAQRTIAHKESSITCGGVGTIKTGQHYDYIIADDLNSHKNSGSPEGCEKVLTHYRYYTSLLEPNGTIAIIGTRYSANDVIGHILENEIMPQASEIQTQI